MTESESCVLVTLLACIPSISGCAHRTVTSRGVSGEFSCDATTTPIDLQIAGDAIANAASIGARDAAEMWGVSIVGPILIVEPSTRCFVASQPVPRNRGHRQMDGLYVGKLPDGMLTANTSVKWGSEEWAMVEWPLPDQQRERVRLLIHESFHRIQSQLPFITEERPNQHLDTLEGRLWLRTELATLEMALRLSGAGSKEAMADALGFARHRHGLFAGAADDERIVELNEGVAEYTGVRLAFGPEAKERAVESIRKAQDMEHLVRSFAYATGPAYGLLLDDNIPGWRSKLSREIGLRELVTLALGESRSPRSGPELLTTAQSYGYNELLAEEMERAKRKSLRIASARERFLDGPVLEIELGNSEFTFDPGAMMPLPGAGTGYQIFSTHGPWGSLEVDGGVLRTGGTLRLPGPVNKTASGAVGDGWSLDLAAGWEILPGNGPGNLSVGRQ